MDASQKSDSQLITGYINGNEADLSRLISRHESRIYTYIISKVRDTDLANDIFQDTFFKVITTLKTSKYNEEGKFLPWAMRIAHNLVIDHFRRLKRIPTISPKDDFDVFDIISDGSVNVERSMIKTQIEQDLRNLIENLPEDQKEVLKMRHYAQMSFKEIAENTNVSINTALGRMRYALINLRKLMEKHNVSLTVQ
ncbi:MAG: sigma-70 family RNA polymerase sigma factor [Schleiferiaceae bacterium]|jgi:RNA polymerase sigma-70 factor (ECF subfamily)|nr:sigma-70 family RNA polymerase sigma factor [Schleiferiaceae bacterium]